MWLFFFFKQKTAYEMRISDWSSDVCSSDLQIYARLSAGPIPDGAFDGDLVFPKGQSGDHRLSEIVGGLGGMAVEWKTLKLEALGRALWTGKVFYRVQRLLRNRSADTRLLQPRGGNDLGDIPQTTVSGDDHSTETRRVGEGGGRRGKS